jgi:hypothetical protein
MRRGKIVLSGTSAEIGGQISEIEAAYLTAGPLGEDEANGG